MNSAYGKTIMKESNHKFVYKSGKAFEVYLSNNYNSIAQIIKIEDADMYCIKLNVSTNDHFNIP